MGDGLPLLSGRTGPPAQTVRAADRGGGLYRGHGAGRFYLPDMRPGHLQTLHLVPDRSGLLRAGLGRPPAPLPGARAEDLLVQRVPHPPDRPIPGGGGGRRPGEGLAAVARPPARRALPGLAVGPCAAAHLTRISKWYVLAVGVVLSAPLSYLINRTVDAGQEPWEIMLNSLCTLVGAAAIVSVGYFLRRRGMIRNSTPVETR